VFASDRQFSLKLQKQSFKSTENGGKSKFFFQTDKAKLANENIFFASNLQNSKIKLTFAKNFGETSFRTLLKKEKIMYWTLELASKLEDAPWPATKEELLDYALRTGLQQEVIENLIEIEDEGEIYESIEDLWPDYPTKEDFFFHEDEY
jgi:hypothetical protein